ncbi:hypothetical protein GE061_020147 [Apolygus lucorum]|uniref:Uncharacterized protein n=1 Tax=Apolygus lucorum TaxID=248454 RepID=A0A6A4IUH4_APOLU|nr:hypothetical protein GE061_020147 [Apolygus lucorum]
MSDEPTPHILVDEEGTNRGQDDTIMRQVNEHLNQFKEMMVNELTQELQDILQPVRDFMTRFAPGMSNTNPADTGFHPPRDSLVPCMSAPMKVKPFDGSVELEAYLIQFETVATANGWDEDSRTTALSSALSGPALALLSDVSPPRTYRRLLAALEERYGVKNQAQMFLTLLNTRTQKPEEDIRQFHQAIRTLARNSVSDVERHGVYHFSRGLRDAEVRRAIDTLSPATMSEALVVALRMEASLQRDRTFRGVGLRSVEDVNVGHPSTSNSQLHQGIQFDPVPNSNNLYLAQNNEMHPVEQQPRRQQLGSRLSPQVACWRCDGLGHYCRNCPTWSINKQQPTNWGNDRRPN